MTVRRPQRYRRAVLLTALIFLTASCGTGGLPSARTSPDATGSADAGPPAPGADAPGTMSGGTPTSTKPTPPPRPVAVVSASPAFGTTAMPPAQPVTIKVARGTIDSLTMAARDGTQVAGKVAADRKAWTLGQNLAFGEVYTVTGTATGTDGRQVPITGTFGTAGTDTAVRNTTYPGDAAVVGVAAPVVVYFGVEPADKAAVAKHVTLTSTPAVEGAWAWVQHDDGRWGLDYRTKDYWPAGTQVHVSAKLYGVELAPGSYGAADITSDFTIGRNQVVVADVNSHELVVKRDGAVVASYPASYGRGEDTGDPNLITRSGTHVVSEFNETKLMSNPRYGYSNVPEKWAVRISDNGEFIHANPASSGAQGNTNVTHGCVNLSLDDAQAYYESAIWGDPVEVSGTSVQLSPDDGDIFDWAFSWDEWKARAVD